VPPLRSIIEPLTDQPPPPARDWPNPYAPTIGPDGGVASAVVYLRGIDPRQGRPWSHPPVLVEMRDHRLQVVQGSRRGPVGFVRAGDRAEFVSRLSSFETVQARGSAFFTLTLPHADRIRSRTLASPGLVELASAAGHFWMRGHLFVDHHPYYTCSDAHGRFSLELVPAGEYDVVAWHPNWRITREERNPDSFRIQKVAFASPLVTVAKARIETGKRITVELPLEMPR
jgi:hypothetical protein